MNDEMKYICPHCKCGVMKDEHVCINCGESFDTPSDNEISPFEQGWWKPLRKWAIIIGSVLLALGLLTSLFHYLAKKEREKGYYNPTTEATTDAVVEDAAPTTEAPVTEVPVEEYQTSVNDMGSMTLKGTVAGSRVVMELENDNGNLTGFYYYVKNGYKTDLQLNGTLSEDGSFELEEFNQQNGIKSGSFSGTMDSEGNASGTFYNSRGSSYNFSLQVEN